MLTLGLEESLLFPLSFLPQVSWLTPLLQVLGPLRSPFFGTNTYRPPGRPPPHAEKELKLRLAECYLLIGEPGSSSCRGEYVSGLWKSTPR